MGLSPTSTMIADHSLSVDIRAFLPGKLNFLDLINCSSTRWTILRLASPIRRCFATAEPGGSRLREAESASSSLRSTRL